MIMIKVDTQEEFDVMADLLRGVRCTEEEIRKVIQFSDNAQEEEEEEEILAPWDRETGNMPCDSTGFCGGPNCPNYWSCH